MIAFLREENLVLKIRLEGRRLRLESREGLHLEGGMQTALASKEGGRRNCGSSAARRGRASTGSRPMAWRTFLQAHWPALVAADFFTTKVWTARGLVTYYTAFVIELHTRRVCVLGATPNPDGCFVVQAVRSLLGESEAVLRKGRILLCDRDPNWTSAMETVLSTVRVRVVRTPPASPNCNAHAAVGAIRRRQRVGGILSHYYRAA
jgi:hypothetical protein